MATPTTWIGGPAPCLDDGNGSLEDTEVDDEVIVCNGIDGAAGEDGGCAAGGIGSLLVLAMLVRRRRRV